MLGRNSNRIRSTSTFNLNRNLDNTSINHDLHCRIALVQEIRQKAAVREDRKELYASQRREKQEREEALRKEMRDK